MFFIAMVLSRFNAIISIILAVASVVMIWISNANRIKEMQKNQQAAKESGVYDKKSSTLKTIFLLIFIVIFFAFVIWVCIMGQNQ